MKPIRGYVASGVAAGIKKTGAKDLGLIFSDMPATIAGVFTQNRVTAAPVMLCRKRIASGNARAIVVNSGNANCVTGDGGYRDAVRMSEVVSEALGVSVEEVFVASTGVIGEPLPMEAVTTGIGEAAKALRADGLPAFAEAIMTTDTHPKFESITGDIGGVPVTVAGVAKGVGMIHPNMATMLAFALTDAAAASETLQSFITTAVDKSFNRISIDGDTSTNDTVLLLANGTAQISLDLPEHRPAFQELLNDLFMRLARMIVKDGEGATKFVTVSVKNAPTEASAKAVAEKIAVSNLVKTAIYGEDANWGRIFMAAGNAGVEFDPQKVDISFNDVLMVENGMGRGKEVEAAASAVLKSAEFTITVDLKAGGGEAVYYTSDLTTDYIRINADYRS
jgi:glutamate N-acetyltransferase/amino-acid N-acetyltransferase